MNKEQVIDAVFFHAGAYYDEGWDIIVESFDRNELERLIYDQLTLQDRNDFPTTPEEAVHIVGEFVKLKNEQRKDIEATAF
jgi:hypothetical protein